jgi:thioredoxin-dependent peroxiredoxin
MIRAMMRMGTSQVAIAVACIFLGVVTVAAQTTATKDSLHVGTQFPDFSLTNLDGSRISLRSELHEGPVVLVVLRGWPGYQCPFCTRQFGDLLSHAGEFEKSKATVIFIYPGDSAELRKHAKEFLANRAMPVNFRFLIDPDLGWVTSHGLRWEAKDETSFPSTLLLDRHGEVRFMATAKMHGARILSGQLLEVLAELHSE